MTFTHEFQLHWILSHSASLRSLSLDDCPIIQNAMIGFLHNKNRHPILNVCNTLTVTQNVWIWHYLTRWHTYFDAFRTGLPHLTHFAFGHGYWTLYAFGHGDWWVPYWDNREAAAAFWAAPKLAAKLPPERYMVFMDGCAGSPWIRTELEGSVEPGRIEGEDCRRAYEDLWDEEFNGPCPVYPDCWGEDDRALRELMRAVRRRRIGE